ncbi:hypothetical protein AGMMS49975_12420 [Clostridia bacterium]|nr:hypothetical protein AGMMS49975_12420 [Clostridia bacterium]
MDTNESLDVTIETIAENGSLLKMAAGVGVGVLVGVLAYKYAVEPIIAKIKERKKSLADDYNEYVETDEEPELNVIK